MSSDSRVEVRIAYIGGGSRDWAPKLMSDLALSPHLGGTLSLYDTDRGAAQANVDVGGMIFGHSRAASRFSVQAVNRLEDALAGADFVVLSIEPGPVTLRFADLEIPRAYGVIQPVADTTGPGGILRALRTVPLYEEFAHQVMRICPRAWVINYTNPMTVCTAALYAAEPAIKAFGCCHEVFNTQNRVADFVSRWFGVAVPDRREIRLDIAGVNHFTFATTAAWGGHDLFPRLRGLAAEAEYLADHSERAREREAREQWFESDGLVAVDFLRRFGALGAAGDRHLVEFVPWYLTSKENLHRWGVVLTPYEWRVRRVASPSRRGPEDPLVPSGEEGVDQMHALLGIAPLVTNVNVPNQGQTPDLPPGAVVETYASLSKDSLRPIVAKRLPGLLASHMRHIAEVQRVTLEAALRKDVDMAFQAILCDPLVRIPTDKARQMFAEMLTHVKDYLSGWKI
jgi:alpha-galactosidase/6-phospho-beta-glucosidase family protein